MVTSPPSGTPWGGDGQRQAVALNVHAQLTQSRGHRGHGAIAGIRVTVDDNGAIR